MYRTDCGGSATVVREPSSSGKLSGRPHDHNSDNRGENAGVAHPIAGCLGRLHHGAAGRVGKGRKQQSLDRESEAEGGDQVRHGRGNYGAPTGAPPGLGPLIGGGEATPAAAVAFGVETPDCGPGGAAFGTVPAPVEPVAFGRPPRPDGSLK